MYQYLSPKGLRAANLYASRITFLEDRRVSEGSVCVILPTHSDEKTAMLRTTLVEVVAYLKECDIHQITLIVGFNNGSGLRETWLDPEGFLLTEIGGMRIDSIEWGFLCRPQYGGDVSTPSVFCSSVDLNPRPGLHIVCMVQEPDVHNKGKIRLLRDIYNTLWQWARGCAYSYEWLIVMDAESRLRRGCVDTGEILGLDRTVLKDLFRHAQSGTLTSPRMFNTPFTDGVPDWTMNVSPGVEGANRVCGVRATQTYLLLAKLFNRSVHIAKQPFWFLNGGMMLGPYSKLLAIGSSACSIFPNVASEDYLISCLAWACGGETLVNEYLTVNGYALASPYPPDTKYQTRIDAGQQQAKSSGTGFWAADTCNGNVYTGTYKDPNKVISPPEPVVESVQTNTQPVNPTPVVPAPIPTTTPTYTCSCSKTCSQMSSCAEAYYQLNTCGCSARDGDDDGIPCESICN